MAIEKQSLSLVSSPEEELLSVEIPDNSPIVPDGIEIEGMPQESMLEIVPDEGESFSENLADIIDERDLRNIGLDLIGEFEAASLLLF